jgi:uncharacterized SAM-binding protein YcdF (DUF218 family)
MYFFLSKLLVYLVYPFLWICILLIIALITKRSRRKNWLIFISLLLLYVFSCPWLLNLYAGLWNVETEVPKNNTAYSCVIVLGGFSGRSEINDYFNADGARFIEAIKLVSTGKAKKIMISGGNASDRRPFAFREAEFVKTQLEKLHYPDSSILIESNSRNTIENAVFSKAVVQKAGLKPPYILVTSDYHMRRARMIFEHKGYQVLAYSTYTNGHNYFNISQLLPDPQTLAWWNTYMKELVGYIVNYYAV